MSLVNRLMSAAGQLFTTTEPAIIEKKQRRNARHILWREWRYSDDEEYARRLAGLVADISSDRQIEPQQRPLAMEVETALRQACQFWSQEAQAVWTAPLRLLDEQQQQPASPTQLMADLSSSDWVKRFVARHTLPGWGGEAVADLAAVAADKKSPLRQTALWLLHSIEVDTTARFAAHFTRLLCPRCLVYYYANEIYIPDLSPFVYYGCRACGQSREFLEWTGEVVTVLDEGMEATYLEQQGVIRGNWLLYRSLFDCDWVEIIRAADEEVERFAVQVGNDTDEIRQPHYEQMRCFIGRSCQLSENTQRVLKSMFGRVEELRSEK